MTDSGKGHHMAKARKQQPAADCSWKEGWPSDGDVRAWLMCWISKAAAIEAVRDRVSRTKIAIERLAENGFAEEAGRELERLIESLPPTDGFHLVTTLEDGAKLYLKLGDMATVEEYLKRILATKPLHTRKCDKGWEVEVVRKFKVFHGLDPSEATNDEERLEARFKMAVRSADELIAQGAKEAAAVELTKAHGLIPQMQQEWKRRWSYVGLLKRYQEMEDRATIERIVRGMSKAERDNALNGERLWELGFEPEALERVEEELASALKALETEDLNVHHYGMKIEHELLFLIKLEKHDLARRWLERVLGEGKSWQLRARGFASAALFSSLAEVVRQLDGPAAAQKLQALALADSQNEKRQAWRGQEVIEDIGRNIGLLAQAGQVDQALQLARKIKSPAHKRKHQVCLLAKFKRWNELHEVLTAAKTPLEAAELSDWVVRSINSGA
jgi:tetratricopeptide (TPR) repeat protein